MLWVPLITGLAVILVIVQTQLRAVNQSWAVLTSTTFTVVVALLLIPQLNQIVGFLQSLSAQAGVSAHYLAPILKTMHKSMSHHLVPKSVEMQMKCHGCCWS